MPGRWTRPDPAGDPGRRDYVPDAAEGCSYFPYRRAELLEKLLGEVGNAEGSLDREGKNVASLSQHAVRR